MEKSDGKEGYAQPTNQDYLSYYVYQGEWRPTRPIGPIGAMSGSPGPAIVGLPTTIGEDKHDLTRPKAPAFKIGHRILTEKSKTGPGPGAYDVGGLTNKGKETNRAPKIGKADRFSERQAVASSSPGPAAYDRKNGDRCIYPKAPAFSMSHGRRGKTKTESTSTPGPNAYNLPPVLGPGKTPFSVGHSYSMGKDERMRKAKSVQSPGPAAYPLPSSNVNFNEAPSFSMGTKAAPPTSGTHSPGPAVHGAHMVKFNKYSTPRITFGIRHSPYKVLPGFSAEK